MLQTICFIQIRSSNSKIFKIFFSNTFLLHKINCSKKKWWSRRHGHYLLFFKLGTITKRDITKYTSSRYVLHYLNMHSFRLQCRSLPTTPMLQEKQITSVGGFSRGKPPFVRLFEFHYKLEYFRLLNFQTYTSNLTFDLVRENYSTKDIFTENSKLVLKMTLKNLITCDYEC